LKEIHTFDDLLVFGKAFLQNKLYRSVVYYGMFGKSADTNGHDTQRDALLKCHNLRCFTTNGQVNQYTQNHQQRSYVDFWCEQTTANKLLEQLMKRFDIYFLVLHPTQQLVKNFVGSRINLTRLRQDTSQPFDEPTNMWSSHSYEDICAQEKTREGYEDEVGYHESYNNIFDSLVYIVFCVKEFNYTIEAADILVEALEQIQ
jgi:hypothetical protein